MKITWSLKAQELYFEGTIVFLELLQELDVFPVRADRSVDGGNGAWVIFVPRFQTSVFAGS